MSWAGRERLQRAGVELIASLNAEQRIALTDPNAPQIVSAGPGSGKTRCLTARICYLIDQGIAPQNILCVTFTRKASLEMKGRIARAVGDNASRVITACTFHQMCMFVLRRDIGACGYDRRFKILDASGQRDVVRSILAKRPPSGRSPRRTGPPSAALVAYHVGRIRGTKARCIPPEVANAIGAASDAAGGSGSGSREKGGECFAVEPESLLRGESLDVYLAYQRELWARNCVDFSDMLQIVARIWSTQPAILARYQNSWQHVLVDEFQDTNRIQYLLVKMLSGPSRRVFAVGDFDQSIYGFRGASGDNYRQFLADFGGRPASLRYNYRSTDTIVRAAAALISHNADTTSGETPAIAMETPPGTPIPITVMVCSSLDDEAARVVRAIVLMAEPPPPPSPPSASGSSPVKREVVGERHYPPHEIAVLYRTRRAGRPIEAAMRRTSVPYSVSGSFPLARRPGPRVTLALLRLVVSARTLVAADAAGAEAEAEADDDDTVMDWLITVLRAHRHPVAILPRTCNVVRRLTQEQAAGPVHRTLSPLDAARLIAFSGDPFTNIELPPLPFPNGKPRVFHTPVGQSQRRAVAVVVGAIDALRYGAARAMAKTNPTATEMPLRGLVAAAADLILAMDERPPPPKSPQRTVVRIMDVAGVAADVVLEDPGEPVDENLDEKALDGADSAVMAARAKRHDLNLLLEDAARFQERYSNEAQAATCRGIALVRAFLMHCSHVETAERQHSTNRRGVTLSTIHSAKGLEFRAVFVVQMNDGVMPIGLQDDNDDEGGDPIARLSQREAQMAEHMREERRVAYVALSRCGEALTLSFSVRDEGGMAAPSPFLQEIPESLKTRAPPTGADAALPVKRHNDQWSCVDKSALSLFAKWVKGPTETTEDCGGGAAAAPSPSPPPVAAGRLSPITTDDDDDESPGFVERPAAFVRERRRAEAAVEPPVPVPVPAPVAVAPPRRRATGGTRRMMASPTRRRRRRAAGAFSVQMASLDSQQQQQQQQQQQRAKRGRH